MRTAIEIIIPATLPVAITLSNDGVTWRGIIPTEAFSTVLYPSIGVAFILFLTSLDAPGLIIRLWLESSSI